MVKNRLHLFEWMEISPYCNGKYLIDVDFQKFLTMEYKISRDENGGKWFKISPPTESPATWTCVQL